MTPDAETLKAIKRHLFAAESSLMGSGVDHDNVREGRQALHRCIDAIAYYGLTTIAIQEMSNADALLLGRHGAGAAMEQIRKAIKLVQAINNKARLEPGQFVA